MKNKSKLLMLLVLMNLALYSQMNNFVMPPFKFGVNTSPTSISPLYSGAPTSGQYFVSNGVYNLNGNLRFYVKDDYIYDPNGSAVGPLGSYSGPYGNLIFLSGEIVILPVPGDCNKYYVLYGKSYGPLVGAAVLYVIVDCSTPTPTVIYNTGTNAFLVMYTSSNNINIASSKKTGTGISAYYDFYAVYTSVGSAIINHFVVNSGGVTGGASIGYSGSIGSLGTELEVSPNGDWLAYNNSSGSVAAIKLTNPSTYATGTEQVYNYSFGRIRGLELVGNGTPDLYVAGAIYPNGGPTIPIFDIIDLTNSIQTPLMIAPYDLNETQIEYTKAGQICGISDLNGTRYFIEYDITSNNFNPTPINNVNPNANANSIASIPYAGTNIYTIPDQVDGEDYNNFSTVPVVTLVGMNINGVNASNVCNGVWQEVYNCNQINLNATFSGGTPCEVELSFHPYDVNCNPLSGPAYFNHAASLAYSAYNGGINNHDVRDYYSNYENSLYTQPGYYVVMLTIRDCCGRESQMFSTILVLAQIPPTISLQMYDYNNPQTYLNYSHNINSPNLVGASSIGFRVSGSTGNVSSMNVKVDEVDNAGTVLGNIFDETKAVANISGLTYEGLNTYCVPATVWGMSPPTTPCNVSNPLAYGGFKSYFSYNNIALVGKNYKMTVTLTNPCSSSSEWTYLNINNAYSKPLATGLENQNLSVTNVIAYPIPAQDKMTFVINSIKAMNITMDLYDVNGRIVKSIAKNMNLTEGEHSINVDVSDLPSGVYSWRINSNDYNESGLLSITK